MDGIAVEGVAQHLGARERCEERHLGFGGQWQGDHAGGRADVPEEREHALADELFRVGRAALGFVAIVQPPQLDAPAVDTTSLVQRLEVQLRAQMELQAQLFGCAAEGSRLPQQNAVVAHAGRLRVGRCRHAGQCVQAGNLARVSE